MQIFDTVARTRIVEVRIPEKDSRNWGFCVCVGGSDYGMKRVAK